MRVSVTDQDIKHGIKGSPSNCPIALAVCRDQKVYRTIVQFGKIYTSTKLFSLPDEANNFVVWFDEGKHVEPFEFEAEEL